MLTFSLVLVCLRFSALAYYFILYLNVVMKSALATIMLLSKVDVFYRVKIIYLLGDLFWFHKRHFPFITAKFFVWNKLTAIQGPILFLHGRNSFLHGAAPQADCHIAVTGTPWGLQITITSVALSHNFILSRGVLVFIGLIND